MPDTTEQDRALAERLAQRVFDKYRQGQEERYDALAEQPSHDRERAILCVLAGLSHRDPHAEREAAKQAWDAALLWVGLPNHESGRDRYLAREYPEPTPPRVTLSDGSVVTEASGECAHDWVPMVGGEVCYGCNRIRRYDNVTYTAPEPIATPRPADAVTEAMRDLLASAIGQAVVSCAHFASRNIPTEAWNVDYAGIIARALAVSPAQRATPGADGAA